MQLRSKILAVDDNPTNLAILEEILSDDYDFKSAANGDEGLELVSRFRPDVVLLDIMMPGLSGYEVSQRIREDRDLRHTKIIMVSAKAQLSERLQGYEFGADDYITKPFDEEELRSKVRVFVKLKSTEEIDRLKTDILSLLSHETRTPLNSVVLPATMLMSEEEMAPAMRRRLGELIFRNARRLQGFFDRILYLSRLRAGQREAPPATVSLRELVRRAVEKAGCRASDRGVRVVEECGDDASVCVTEGDMERVFLALLDNAIRFSPPGSEVVVGIGSGPEGASVRVTDRGAGIDPEVLPHIFDEFADFEEFADAGPAGGEDVDHYLSGFGLSLAIARHIVSMHSGTIDVDSEQGSGTTFTVRLPHARDGVVEVAAAEASAGAAESH